MDDNLEKLTHFIHGSTPIPGPVIGGFISVAGQRPNCSVEERQIFEVLIDYIEKLEERVKELEDNNYQYGGIYNDTERH